LSASPLCSGVEALFESGCGVEGPLSSFGYFFLTTFSSGSWSCSLSAFPLCSGVDALLRILESLGVSFFAFLPILSSISLDLILASSSSFFFSRSSTSFSLSRSSFFFSSLLISSLIASAFAFLDLG